MIFTDIFIKRPIFATAISLMILVVGIVSLTKLDIRLFPKIDTPVINVQITYPGANPGLMEGFVTTPVENAIASVEGIDYIASQSSQSTSSINVNMKPGYDLDIALINVSNKVSSVRWELPKEIEDPVVSKAASGGSATLYLTFKSNSMSAEAVTDYLIRVVQPQLQMQPGVNSADILGERKYAMRVWLDPKLMAAHNVTARDISQAIYANNVQSAAGQLKGKMQQYDVYANTDLTTQKEFNDIVIRNDNGRIIRIKDIGKTKLGAQNTDVSIFIKHNQATFMAIVSKSNANPLDVVKAIKKVLPDIKEHLPKDLHMSIMYDVTKFISASLKEVQHTIIMAVIFVFIVIFLTIGSLRSILIPVVTIPLSIIGTGSLMLLLGYSINTLTLLAFVLAIGLVVDDSIVVLENIHRHLEEGLPPFKAAIVGAREIAFAVIAMTLTLAAVYAPIGFMTGLTGKLFSEFAFTLAGAILFSGFIALTLSPMMCSKFYSANENLQTGFAGFVNRTFSSLTTGYRAALQTTLKLKFLVIIVALLIYASCFFFYTHIHKELAPQEDQGVIIGIVQGPAAANLKYIEQHTKQIMKIYDSVPEMETYGIVNGYPLGLNSSISFLILTPWNQRHRTAMEIQQNLFPRFWSIPGIIAFPTSPPILPGTSSLSPVDFVLKTTADYVTLEKYTEKFQQAIEKWGGLTSLNVDLHIDKPQADTEVMRNKAADLNVNMNEIAANLNVFLGKPITTRFNLQGRSYEVLPQLYDQYRTIPDKLNNLYVRTSKNQLIPLANVVKVDERTVPRTLNHFQELRSATISANLAPGVTQGQAYDYLQQLAKKILPKNIQIDTSGQLRQYVTASGKMAGTFIFAIIFIYLILAAQFESFRDPFIVMLSVPLSIAGALLVLMVFGATINIYTQIGLVTLIGLITKNGILIVEFANQQQEKGKEFLEAILDGASYRLRPILMTTCAMILGATPLIFASGAGAVSRHQLGLVIVGGMSFGTFLTLFVIPTAYYLLASKKSKNVEMTDIVD
jgi:multidrug efflux pump